MPIRHSIWKVGGMADLTKARLTAWNAGPGTIEWGDALIRARETSRPEATRLRDREAAAATRAAPFIALRAKGVRARDWLAAARDEQVVPVMVMMSE